MNHKYKPGDKVRIIGENYKNHVFTIGRVSGVIQPYQIELPGGTSYWFSDDELVSVQTDWDSLTTGTILVGVDGKERAVLGGLGQLVFFSVADDHKTAMAFQTVDALKEWGWRIKQDEPAPEVTELTIEEVAAKFGLKPEQVRIKDGDE